MSHFSLESTRKEILNGDRRALAKAITLLESNRCDSRQSGTKLLESMLLHTGNSIRIAITGVAGVGKSTFIDVFGLHLLEKGHKIAVLAVDPSSPMTGGSILGDKTRMLDLSQHPMAFIRPSPTSGIMGGTAQQTRETIMLCEAAGYDVVLVETVGVGQSEIEAASMVDLFVLMTLPNAGDKIQAIKKGILEMADLVIVNKADGHLKNDAENTCKQITNGLSFNKKLDDLSLPKVLTCSALKGEGQKEVLETVIKKKKWLEQNGLWEKKREFQMRAWFKQLVKDELYLRFFNHPGMSKKLDNYAAEVRAGGRLPSHGAIKLVEEWLFNKEG